MSMTLETTEIAGMTVDIQVSRSGTFYIYPAGSTHAALGVGETLDKALTSARREIARYKAKVSVPFTTMAGESGVATGLHAKTRAVLARIDDRPAQLAGGRDSRVFIDIPEDDLRRYLLLDEQIRGLRRDQRAIEDQYVQQLKPLVERAITNAAEEK